MIVTHIKSHGIAHNSYFLASSDSAAVIDPRRDCHVYMDLAREHGARISHIFETHRNEDCVVGSRELSSLTGAEVLHGTRPDWGYGAPISDGDNFRIGHVSISCIHTPGHTDESMTYSVTDLTTGKAPVAVFTGDTLFVGEVGRTDLYGASEIPRLASSLYSSLHERILPLGDGVIIYPAHGAGSVCGARIAAREDSTLGTEKVSNPMLRLAPKETFVQYKIAEELEKPPFFRRIEEYNIKGPPLPNSRPVPSLTPAEFKEQIDKGALVIDTSLPAAFGGAHIRGSHSIWLGGLPVFAGWVLPYDWPVALALEDDAHLSTAVTYLFRAGFDNIVGYLRGGIESWYDAGYPIDHLPIISVHELKEKLDTGDSITVLDVRGKGEWDSGHIKGATHVYVGHIEQRLAEIPRDLPVAVLCNVGHRASVAASLLLRTGYRDVFNVLGSMKAWTASGYPKTKD